MSLPIVIVSYIRPELTECHLQDSLHNDLGIRRPRSCSKRYRLQSDAAGQAGAGAGGAGGASGTESFAYSPVGSGSSSKSRDCVCVCFCVLENDAEAQKLLSRGDGKGNVYMPTVGTTKRLMHVQLSVPSESEAETVASIFESMSLTDVHSVHTTQPQMGVKGAVGTSTDGAVATDDDDESDIPALFLCPITSQLIEDPRVTPCGHIFEATVITEWLEKSAKCPIDNMECTVEKLAMCFPLKTAIDDYLADKAAAKEKCAEAQAAAATEAAKNASVAQKVLGELDGHSSDIRRTASVERAHVALSQLVASYNQCKPGAATLEQRDEIAIRMLAFASKLTVTEDIDLMGWLLSNDRGKCLAAVRMLDWHGRHIGLTNALLIGLMRIVLNPVREVHGRFIGYYAMLALNSSIRVMDPVQIAFLQQNLTGITFTDESTANWQTQILKVLQSRTPWMNVGALPKGSAWGTGNSGL